MEFILKNSGPCLGYRWEQDCVPQLLQDETVHHFGRLSHVFRRVSKFMELYVMNTPFIKQYACILIIVLLYFHVPGTLEIIRPFSWSLRPEFFSFGHFSVT